MFYSRIHLLFLLHFLIDFTKPAPQGNGPTFEKDGDGNAIIDIPQKYWKNKSYGSLKIHLSHEVLQNLTNDFHHEEYEVYHDEDCKLIDKSNLNTISRKRSKNKIYIILISQDDFSENTKEANITEDESR